MPTVRTGFGWATYRGRIFIVGGETYENHIVSAVRAVEAYDPATNTWTRYPSLPLARHGVSVAVIGNRLIVAGGHIQGDPRREPRPTRIKPMRSSLRISR